VKKFKEEIVILLIAGLALRLMLSFFGTLSLDFNTFVAWSIRLANLPLSDFYLEWSDYLPGYLYVLMVLGKINLLGIIPQTVLYKLPAIFSDLATGAVIYLIVKRVASKRLALITSGFYIFNPAIIANSTLWGQVDSLTAFFSITSVGLLSVNPIISALFLALGAVIKPQAAITALVILFVMIRDRWKLFKIIGFAAISAAIFVLAFLPFSGNTNVIQFIVERLSMTLNQYPYTSVNAFNFWGFFGFWISESGKIISPNLIGAVLTLVIGILSSNRLWDKKNGEYYLLAILYIANFMFFSRMHERHLLPALAPLSIIAVLNPYFWIAYIGYSFTYVLNLYYAYVWITRNFKEVFPIFITKSVILTNIFLFITAFYGILSNTLTKYSPSELYQKFVNSFKKKETKEDFYFTQVKLTDKKRKIILVLILFFAIATRLIYINKPTEEYFDEVYHAFTARIMLQGDPKAWEWWNPHPEGFAYEWTHPPLAKEGMVAGMWVFGQRAIGWRIPGVILGVGAVYLVYLITKELFKDEMMSLLAAGIYSLEGLPLVMSRIGMNDSYLVFFVLLSLLLYIKDRHFLSAMTFGLAIASKWSAIWAVPIFFVVFLVLKKKPRLSYFWYMFIPPLVYLASYIPMFLTGHGFDIFTGVQQQMWWYHTNLEATHPFTSPWYTWPFLGRPIWLYTKEVGQGLISNIYAMGNPVIFWIGVVSITLSVYLAYVEKNKKLALVVFSYLLFFVPWAASPRIMFLYHYLPSIPFMAIAIAFILRRNPKLIPWTAVAGALAFFYFFPRFTGIPVPAGWDCSFHWFSSW
jgi:predicted membrane-bound dolichyl-phosphate-mannose-protein mannosyltransferase